MISKLYKGVCSKDDSTHEHNINVKKLHHFWEFKARISQKVKTSSRQGPHKVSRSALAILDTDSKGNAK